MMVLEEDSTARRGHPWPATRRLAGGELKEMMAHGAEMNVAFDFSAMKEWCLRPTNRHVLHWRVAT